MKNADKFKRIFGTYATEVWTKPEKEFVDWLNEDLPSAQPVNYGPTNLIDSGAALYGYKIEHLAMIANVMKAKKVTPEEVIEILTNVGEVVAMCHAEFEESLRKAVERCWSSEKATSFALTEKGDEDG